MRLKYLAPVLIVTACIALVLAYSPGVKPSPRSDYVEPEPVAVELLERSPSWSLGDWLSQAEVVATVRIVSESADAAATASETESGDGLNVIGRLVTVEVVDRLWTRQATNAPSFPTRFEMTALGWGTEPGAKRVDLVSVGESRLETGNTYVVAFRWYPASCEGEGAADGRWGAIGSGGVVPLSGSTLGRGEVAGVQASVDRFAKLVPGGSVQAAIAGSTPRDLQLLLGSGDQRLASRPAPAPAGCQLSE